MQNDVQLFPILVINTGSVAACNVMSARIHHPELDQTSLPETVYQEFSSQGCVLTSHYSRNWKSTWQRERILRIKSLSSEIEIANCRSLTLDTPFLS